MGTIFYIHRLSKLIDEIVKDLGLTLTLSDESGDVKLAPQLENIKQLASQLGVKVAHQVQSNGSLVVTFSRK
jgi:hypothetical protein